MIYFSPALNHRYLSLEVYHVRVWYPYREWSGLSRFSSYLVDLKHSQLGQPPLNWEVYLDPSESSITVSHTFVETSA